MRLINLSLLLTALFCTGCMYRGRDKIVYIRPDHNSLNRPAIHIDKFSHQPPRSRNVDHYRWMYNKGPIDHTLLPELYTHEPITSQTLAPVVAAQMPSRATQIGDTQWQWSESDTRTANNGQAVQQISHKKAASQQQVTAPPTAKPNWMFSPVVAQ